MQSIRTQENWTQSATVPSRSGQSGNVPYQSIPDAPVAGSYNLIDVDAEVTSASKLDAHRLSGILVLALGVMSLGVFSFIFMPIGFNGSRPLFENIDVFSLILFTGIGWAILVIRGHYETMHGHNDALMYSPDVDSALFLIRYATATALCMTIISALAVMSNHLSRDNIIGGILSTCIYIVVFVSGLWLFNNRNRPVPCFLD